MNNQPKADATDCAKQDICCAPADSASDHMLASMAATCLDGRLLGQLDAAFVLALAERQYAPRCLSALHAVSAIAAVAIEFALA